MKSSWVRGHSQLGTRYVGRRLQGTSNLVGKELVPSHTKNTCIESRVVCPVGVNVGLVGNRFDDAKVVGCGRKKREIQFYSE